MGEETTKYVSFCMSRIQLLAHHGVEAIVVLDGAHLPAKASTEGEREKSRNEYRIQAQQCLDRGDKEGAWRVTRIYFYIAPFLILITKKKKKKKKKKKN